MAVTAARHKTTHSTEYTIDLSDGQDDREPNKFDNLCENVVSCYVSHGNCLTEFYNLKDELLKHSLPPCLLLQLTLASSRIYRSYSDLSVPLREMTRMVKQYSMPWEEKGTVLKKLKAEYESKRQQLSIAVKHLEMVAIEEERMQHERRLNNWMRLYTRTMATKSHGRRWKFRIEPFKRKLAEGYNPFGTDFSESDDTNDDDDDDDDEKEEEDGQSSLLDSENGETELRFRSGKKKGLTSDLSEALASNLKKVKFPALQLSSQPPASPELATPPNTRPIVETADVSCWTGEPDYTDYLLVLLYRPRGVLEDKDVCCTLSLEGQFCTSGVFKAEENITCHPFHFLLSENAVKQFTEDCFTEEEEEWGTLLSATKLAVAVFPRTIAEPMAAHCSIPLSELQLTKTQATVIVPPDTRDEEEEETKDNIGQKTKRGFFINWEELSTIQEDLAEHLQSVAEYPLKLDMDGPEEEEEEIMIPSVPLVCHRVRLHRHKIIHAGTSTTPWNKLLEEEGYRKARETISAATSAIALPEKTRSPSPPPSPELKKNGEEEGAMSAEQVAELTLCHAEEMKQLQWQYEKKLEMLSRTLARVKKDKEEEIRSLEQALSESEASKSKRQKSSSDIRAWLERRRRLKQIDHKLPVWGKDLPKNFFERLELFAEESLKKHQELTERIRREVQETCEKQLALQHRLAPPTINTTTAMEDVCLPAIFMPTSISSSSKAVVYNPRAHSYFHPPGSLDARVTQPPSIFKLPPVQANQLATLNLYDLTQSNSVHTGPTWLKSDQYSSSSPQQSAPAPPPSACDFYRHHQQHQQQNGEHLAGQQQSMLNSPLPVSGRNSRLDTLTP